MVVCHCKAVTDRTVDAAVASGARTVADVTAWCRAGGGCGGCHRLLETLIEACGPRVDASVTSDASAA